MADVGQGATIVLDGLGTLEATAIKVPDHAITAHDTTKLSDTVKQSAPGRVQDLGRLEGDLFVDDGTVPTIGWEGTATVTYPTPAGMTTPRVDVYTGFIDKVGGHTIEPDGLMRYSVSFVCNAVSHTAAA